MIISHKHNTTCWKDDSVCMEALDKLSCGDLLNCKKVYNWATQNRISLFLTSLSLVVPTFLLFYPTWIKYWLVKSSLLDSGCCFVVIELE